MFEKTHYTNGQKVFEFEGDKLTYFFKTGIKKAEGIFADGHMEGDWKFYRESGMLWQTGSFLRSQKHGLFLRYDKAGNLEYNQEFVNGKPKK